MQGHDPNDLAGKVEVAYEKVRSAIEGLSEEQWTAVTDAEGWPIGVVANHIAIGSRFVMDLAEHVAGGGDITWDSQFIDSANEQAAAVFAGVTQKEALETLDEQLPEAARRVRTMDATQLNSRASSPMVYEDGSELWSPGDLIERMIVAHAYSHLSSITGAGAD